MLKKKLIYLFPVLCAILFVGGSKAQAQVSGELRAKIPFEFHAGGATLPAGTYTINVVSGLVSNLLEIRSDDNGAAAALLQTMDVDSTNISTTAQLLFDQKGGDYYLAEIFGHDGNYGVEVRDPDYTKKYKASLPAVDLKHVAMVYKGY